MDDHGSASKPTPYLDNKFGEITTEHGNLFPGEPVFILRARDNHSLAAIAFYAEVCRDSGSPDDHIAGVSAAAAEMRAWRALRPDLCKNPD